MELLRRRRVRPSTVPKCTTIATTHNAGRRPPTTSPNHGAARSTDRELVYLSLQRSQAATTRYPYHSKRCARVLRNTDLKLARANVLEVARAPATLVKIVFLAHYLVLPYEETKGQADGGIAVPDPLELQATRLESATHGRAKALSTLNQPRRNGIFDSPAIV